MARATATAAPVVHDELAEAEAAHQALLDRIDSDAQVSPLELAEAEAAIRLAETRTDLLDRRAAAAAEAKRLARIREIHAELTSGELATHAAAAEKAYGEMVAAGRATVAAVTKLDGGIAAAWRELRALGDPPEDVDVLTASTPGRVTVDGMHLWSHQERAGILLALAAVEASGGGRVKADVAKSIGHPYAATHLDLVRRLASRG
jgi:hypothetical protein